MVWPEPAIGGTGPKWELSVGPVNLHHGLYLYVLDKPRVDCTLAQLVPWCVDKNLRFPSVGHFISNINISPI